MVYSTGKYYNRERQHPVLMGPA